MTKYFNKSGLHAGLEGIFFISISCGRTQPIVGGLVVLVL